MLTTYGTEVLESMESEQSKVSVSELLFFYPDPTWQDITYPDPNPTWRIILVPDPDPTGQVLLNPDPQLFNVVNGVFITECFFQEA